MITTSLPHTLPPLLKDVVGSAISPVDADMMLLSAITAMSACMPNVQGKYGRRMVYPNLFLFISAPASAGKGRLMLTKRIVEPIHKELRQAYNDEIAKFQQEMEEKGKTINMEVQVPQTMLFMPANSSATALYQTLHDCGGSGLIFETEADTLATALKSDYGNFSDGLRKAFHHETISYNRRKEREFVEINTPRLSVVLAGTPRQIQTLIPDTENGLFSRFIMYRADMKLEWMDVFEEEWDDDAYFNMLGNRFYSIHRKLKMKKEPINFALNKTQCLQFNQCFAKWQEELTEFFGTEITPSVRRLGLIAYRIAMIMSILRCEKSESTNIPTEIVCSDADFENAIFIIEELIDHMSRIFNEMPRESEEEKELTPLCNVLLQSLPETFDSKIMINISLEMGISKATTFRYIQTLIKTGKIKKKRHNTYLKL